MINSVQTIQTSLKNAPDNVFGIVKGISDNLTNESPGSKGNDLKSINFKSSQTSLKSIDENSTKTEKPKSNDNENQVLTTDDLVNFFNLYFFLENNSLKIEIKQYTLQNDYFIN